MMPATGHKEPYSTASRHDRCTFDCGRSLAAARAVAARAAAAASTQTTGRRVRSHDQRRIGWHYLGWIDPERVVLANCLIGNLFWSNIFGDPNAVPLHVARIIRFPERRSQIAQIRDELAKLKTVSVR